MDFEDCIILLKNGSNLDLYLAPHTGGDILLLRENEARLLYNYAKQTSYTEKENAILEIGRYRGGSTMLLAVATHHLNVNIISVDIVDGCRFCYADAYDWLNQYEEKERVNIRVDNSWTMENFPISLLFVDGDHTYEGIKNDFTHHWNYLNGDCLAHDYDRTNPTKAGVTKFINEWIKEGYAEIIEQVGSMVALRKLKDYKNGTKFVGEFKDGRKNGQGTSTFLNGAKYVGEFKDGVRHGQGTLTFTDGTKFVGEFKDGKIWNGQGTETLPV